MRTAKLACIALLALVAVLTLAPLVAGAAPTPAPSVPVSPKSSASPSESASPTPTPVALGDQTSSSPIPKTGGEEGLVFLIAGPLVALGGAVLHRRPWRH